MNEKVISSILEATREGEMINQDKWGAISSLLAQRVKKKAIARLLGLHIQTVRKWAAEGSWTPFRRPIRGKKLDPYQEWAKVRLPQIGYNAVVLQEELEAQGYTGSYQQVKRFVRPLREERDRLEAATVRYETAPGQQAQVDWGTAWVSLGGREVRVQFFVMVLGYSRRIFARATLDQKIPALLSCHEAAFEHYCKPRSETVLISPVEECTGDGGAFMTV
jgi:transposase